MAAFRVLGSYLTSLTNLFSELCNDGQEASIKLGRRFFEGMNIRVASRELTTNCVGNVCVLQSTWTAVVRSLIFAPFSPFQCCSNWLAPLSHPLLLHTSPPLPLHQNYVPLTAAMWRLFRLAFVMVDEHAFEQLPRYLRSSGLPRRLQVWLNSSWYCTRDCASGCSDLRVYLRRDLARAPPALFVQTLACLTCRVT
jgi:hypothetical protein